jgi:hypothetical protein
MRGNALPAFALLIRHNQSLAWSARAAAFAILEASNSGFWQELSINQNER